MSDRSANAAGDPTLVRRFRAGDATAFDRIVERHRGEIYRVARRVLRSHEEADEAAQETFVRAWRALNGFRGDSSLRTWLIRIAINVSRTLSRRRPPETPLEDLPQTTDGSPGADDLLQRERVQAYLRRAVTDLPPRQREVVALKVFSEMTYRDVAQVMGLSEGAVKAHLHQAVANLRRRMSETVVG